MKCTEVNRLMKSDQWMDADADTLAELRGHARECLECGERYSGLLRVDLAVSEAFQELMHDTRVPGTVRRAWMAGLRPDARAGGRPGLPRVAARSLAGIAAGMAILIAACVVGPTVILYAGSLPGIGSILSALGADRGLLLAAEQGLVADVNITVEGAGMSMTVGQVVGDPTRVAITVELRGEELAGAADPTLFFAAELSDQWGRSYGPPTSFVVREIGDDAVQAILTFRGVNVRTRHLTLRVSEAMGISGDWTVRFPVDLIEAHRLTHTLWLNMDTVLDPSLLASLGLVDTGEEAPRVRVEEVVLAPTSTTITLAFLGLETAWPDEYTLEDEDGNRYQLLGSSRGGQSGHAPGRAQLSFEPVGAAGTLILSAHRFESWDHLAADLNLELAYEDGMPAVVGEPGVAIVYGSSISARAIAVDEEGLHVQMVISGGSVMSIDIELIDHTGGHHRPYRSGMSATGPYKRPGPGGEWTATATFTFNPEILAGRPRALTVHLGGALISSPLAGPVTIEIPLPADRAVPGY